MFLQRIFHLIPMELCLSLALTLTHLISVKTINLFLIFYDNDGTSYKSNTITSLLVSKDNRIPFKPYNISLIKFY